MSKKGLPWTAEECATAARMWQELGDMTKIQKCREIGKAIGRSYLAVEFQEKVRGPTFDGIAPVAERLDPRNCPPAHVLEERNRAYAGDVSLTAAWMGDPLPGRSALERMGR